MLLIATVPEGNRLMIWFARHHSNRCMQSRDLEQCSSWMKPEVSVAGLSLKNGNSQSQRKTEFRMAGARRRKIAAQICPRRVQPAHGVSLVRIPRLRDVLLWSPGAKLEPRCWAGRKFRFSVFFRRPRNFQFSVEIRRIFRFSVEKFRRK